MTSNSTTNIKFTFSGHESFQCRQLWLKKGYHFVNKKKSYNNDDAVVELGVGKNMVSSIRFWMKAFNLLTPTDELTDFSHRLLSDDGYDPYMEDEGTLWFLQQSVKGKMRFFNFKLSQPPKVEIINFICEFKSIANEFADYFEVTQSKNQSQNILLEIFNRYHALGKKNPLLF